MPYVAIHVGLDTSYDNESILYIPRPINSAVNHGFPYLSGSPLLQTSSYIYYPQQLGTLGLFGADYLGKTEVAGTPSTCSVLEARYVVSGNETQNTSYAISPRSTNQISWDYSTTQGKILIFHMETFFVPTIGEQTRDKVYVKTNSLNSPTNTFTFTPNINLDRTDPEWNRIDPANPHPNTKFFFNSNSTEIVMRDSLGQALGNITSLYFQNTGSGAYVFYAWTLKDTRA